MKKVKAAIIAAVCLILLTAGFFSTHFFIDDRIFSIFSEDISLSGCAVEDINALTRCISLKRLDLSSTGISDIEVLQQLDQLEYLDLSGNTIDIPTLAALLNSNPDCEIIYTAALGDISIDSHTESVTLNDNSAQDCEALLLLRELKYVDITACTSVTESMLSVSANSARSFLWQMELGASMITSDASELLLEAPTACELDRLRLFDRLERVTVTDCDSYDALLELVDALPECEFVWSVELCGVTVLSTDTTVVLDDHEIRDFEDFSARLAYLPSLERIDMCRCGLSNEQMEELSELYPHIKFVWEITFGNPPVMWTVRTDITCFSSLGRIRCDDEQLAPLLKYCTDLVALDLGHHNITDLTPISRMTELKVLILGDNPISDLSPLASLKKLQYIEIFSCKFTDVSVLAELPELIDVCIGGNKIDDITPFLSMTQLKMLWIPNCGLSISQRDMLTSALPDCTFKFAVIRNLCEDWRVTDRNIAIRKAFGNWEYVVDFNNWDDVVYIDGAKLVETFPMPLH